MFRYNAYIHGYTNAHFNIQKCPKYIKIEGGFSFPPKGVFWPTVPPPIPFHSFPLSHITILTLWAIWSCWRLVVEETEGINFRGCYGFLRVSTQRKHNVGSCCLRLPSVIWLGASGSSTEPSESTTLTTPPPQLHRLSHTLQYIALLLKNHIFFAVQDVEIKLHAW